MRCEIQVNIFDRRSLSKNKQTKEHNINETQGTRSRCEGIVRNFEFNQNIVKQNKTKQNKIYEIEIW